ncbi:MAG: hypothetical protein IJ173_12340, partial [Kiritimatiellae bacterium]|nr:hypothetical protein [Kiritimatiellia bacterium]
MNAQDVILSSKVLHLRELKGEVERLKAECQRLRNESAALKEHFDLALVAAQDLRALPDGGAFVVVDGWNDPEAVIAGCAETLGARAADVRLKLIRFRCFG